MFTHTYTYIKIIHIYRYVYVYTPLASTVAPYIHDTEARNLQQLSLFRSLRFPGKTLRCSTACAMGPRKGPNAYAKCPSQSLEP